jgi:hypothetical protein
MHFGGFYGNTLVTETPGISFLYGSGVQEPADTGFYLNNTSNGNGGSGAIIKTTGSNGTVQRDVTKTAFKGIFSEAKNLDGDGNACGYFGYG